MIERLRRRFRSTFVGRAYFEELARIYSAARLVFNRSLRSDVNMRVFEALASGSLLLTNDLAENGQLKSSTSSTRRAESVLDSPRRLC